MGLYLQIQRKEIIKAKRSHKSRALSNMTHVLVIRGTNTKDGNQREKKAMATEDAAGRQPSAGQGEMCLEKPTLLAT